MKRQQPNSLQQQRGVAMLATTLVVLVAMAIMTAIGARMAINNQRVASNAAFSDGAFQVADAGIDNVLAYLNHNRAYVASTEVNGWFHASSNPKWTACDPSFTGPPCGDDTANLYGSDWLAYGPVLHLQNPDVDYSSVVYLLSQNIDDIPANDIDLGCLNLSLASILPVNLLNGILTGLLSILNSVLQPVIVSLLQTVGLPSDLCLPLNFNGANTPPAPSSANPSLRAVSYAENIADSRGGTAQIQQDIQTASAFAWDPMAAIMVDGTANLNGDIHVWGNPRPPSRPPYDWSVLDLGDVAGLNVTSLLGDFLGTAGAPLHALTLAPILNLSVDEVLALDINVTFPLSIWSHSTTTLQPGPLLSLSGLSIVPILGTLVGTPNLSGVLSGARTCMPPYSGNPTCTLFASTSAGINPTLPLLPNFTIPIKLPDIQDEENLLSTVTGLLDTSAPVAFPDDLFDHVFGVPAAESAFIEEQATALADCSDLHNKPAGMYWISGDCAMSGTIGSSTDPLIVIAEGNLSLAAGTEFWGVTYLTGPTARTVTGTASLPKPIMHGSLIVDANLTASDDFNVVYDRDAIRRAGYRAGYFARLPGGWSDEITGP
ncbi:MAG: pilus assembly PilX family protein [Nevskiales bacterium]